MLEDESNVREIAQPLHVHVRVMTIYHLQIRLKNLGI